MNKKFVGAVLCILVLLLAAIPTNADNLKGKDLKHVQQSVEEAFECAEEEVLPLEGITGVSYTEEPARVIVYIESEEYRATVPDKIKGYETEIRISGNFYALGMPLAEEALSVEKTDEDVFSSDAVELTQEELSSVYDSLEEIKEQDILYYMLAKKALRDATTLTDDGAIVNVDQLASRMQNYEAKLAPLLAYCLSLSKTTPILGDDRLGKVRPLVGGISCSIPWYFFLGLTAGTLGGVTDTGFMVSNAHVFSMNRFGHQYLPGIPIIQQGSIDGGFGAGQSVIGRLVARSTIRWRQHNDVDAAVAIVWGVQYDADRQLGNDGSRYYVNFGGTVHPYVGRTMRKSGRTTGVTTNEIIDVQATVKVHYTTLRWAYFDNQILIDEPFIEPGDSGSVVEDLDSGLWVGLIFAGGTEYAVANPAGAVCNEFAYLNLDLWGN